MYDHVGKIHVYLSTRAPNNKKKHTQINYWCVAGVAAELLKTTAWVLTHSTNNRERHSLSDSWGVINRYIGFFSFSFVLKTVKLLIWSVCHIYIFFHCTTDFVVHEAVTVLAVAPVTLLNGIQHEVEDEEEEPLGHMHLVNALIQLKPHLATPLKP